MNNLIKVALPELVLTIGKFDIYNLHNGRFSKIFNGRVTTDCPQKQQISKSQLLGFVERFGNSTQLTLARGL